MTQVGIALDDIVEIADFSNATMLALATRLERSSAFQELIAREIELDELWRRVETGVKALADDPHAADVRQTLLAIFDLVWQAHDLAGAEQPREAAARLRSAAVLRRPQV
jgi:citrate synthase